MPDDLNPESTVETPSAPTVELPEGFGKALQDRFGSTSNIGLADFEGGVGIDAAAQLAATGIEVPAPVTPEPPADGSALPLSDPSASPASTAEPTSPVAPDVQPATGDQPAAPVEPSAETQPPTEPSAAPGGWDHQYVDETGATQTQHFDDSQIRRGLELTAWADSLPPEMRSMLGAVESGQAVAIPRADYDSYVAWRHAQDTQSRDADLDQFEPDAARVIREQREQIAALQSIAQAPQSNYVDPNLSAWAMRMDNAAVEWGKSRGLTPEETGQLWQATVNSGIIRHLAVSQARYSPTGTLLAPADPAQVAYQALDFNLTQNPTLHQAAIERYQSQAQSAQSSAAPATQPATNHASAPTPAPDPGIQAKKALASSVTSAPSAVVNPSAPRIPPPGPELVAAMAADLTPVMNGH